MKLTLQELLEQKALLEKHLGWLKEKISEAQKEAEPELDKEPLSQRDVKSTEQEPSRAGSDTPSLPEGLPLERPFEFTSGTKIGCWVFAIGAMVLFLFLLFGLPYYI